MDDFNVSSLHESKNEWGSRLLTILTPLINEGLVSIFEESVTVCKENDEYEKYLMTFQNFISRIPKWNATIIETETKRIIDRSGCGYLEDLVTCVHIIQLKLLTAMRVGQKQKKIDIDVPKLDDFVHKVYITIARKVYKNVYLFEANIPPLQKQKNHRELEIIIQECILNTVRESIPVETILRAYMDETIEEDVQEEIVEQLVDEPVTAKTVKDTTTIIGENKVDEKKKVEDVPALKLETEELVLKPSLSQEEKSSSSEIETESIGFPELPEDNTIKFNNFDKVLTSTNEKMDVFVPKDVESVEGKNMQQSIDSISSIENYDDDNAPKLKIFDTDVNLDVLDVHSIEPPSIKLDDSFLLDEIEVLA
jgi:hypothetical protein